MKRLLLLPLVLALIAWTHGASTALPPSSFNGNPQYTVQSISNDGIGSFTLTPGSGGSNVTATFDASGVGVAAITAPIASPGVINWPSNPVVTDQPVTFVPAALTVAGGGLFNIASSLVNWPAHGFAADQRVSFLGSLPTNVVAFTNYSVFSVDADHFQLCAAAGCPGGVITFGGTATGSATGTAGLPTGISAGVVYFAKATPGPSSFQICAAAGCAGGAIDFTGTNGTGARFGSTSIITTNSPHGLTSGSIVALTLPTGGTLPAGTQVGTPIPPDNSTIYYAVTVLSPTQIRLFFKWAWRHSVNAFNDYQQLTSQGTGTGHLITDITYREYTNVALTGSGTCAGAVANVYVQSGSVRGLYLTNPGHGCTTSDTFTIPTLPAPDNGLTGAGGTITQVGLATSRTSARTPFFVQVSARGMWANSPAGNDPIPFNGYEDLEYTWNFGDASGTETFTRPTDGAAVNANTDQIGPQAMYVYRNPGSYTITLTARGWKGGQFVTATKTQSVTATQTTPGKEVWFNPGCTGAPRTYCPSGGGDGLTAATAFTSADQATNLVNTMQGSPTTKTDWVIHFARGSAFTGAGRGLETHQPTITAMRLDDCLDYTCMAKFDGGNGVNTKPAFNIASNNPLNINVISPGVLNDITISNMQFNGVGTNGTQINSSFQTNSFAYLDGVDISATGVTTSSGNYADIMTASGSKFGFGMYKTTVTGDLAAETIQVNTPQIVGGTNCSVWCGVMGVTLAAGGAPNAGSAHGFYVFDAVWTPRDQTYFAWNTNGATPQRTYYTKLRMGFGGGGIALIQNSTSNISVSIENEVEADDPVFSGASTVVDGNAFFSTGGFNAGALYEGATQQPSLTIRNNRIWGVATLFNPPHTTPNNVTTNFKVYKNKAYSGSSNLELGNFNYLSDCGPDPPAFVCGPWTAPAQFTDNQFRQAGASSAIVMGLGFSQFLSIGSSAHFVRNQYYAASGVTNVFDNSDNGIGGVSANFTTWKSSTGLDSGTGANLSTFNNSGTIPPGWTTLAPSQWSDFGP